MWKTSSVLVGAVLILLTLGVVMLASTSETAVKALNQTDPDTLHFVKRQIAYILAGALGCFICSRVHFSYWKKFALWFCLGTIVLLIMVIIPGVGLEVKGSYRWLKFGPLNFQPSELSKLALIVGMSAWLCRVQRKTGRLRHGLVIPMGILGVYAALVFAEPDFGTTLLLGVVGMGVMFMAGTRLSYLILSGAVGLSAFVLAVMQNPVRMRRIIAFLDPEKYAEKEAFQLLNAIFAFILGGGQGVGLGQSIQKKFYLPEAHTDFIFAIIGEEMGLYGSLSVVFLFLTIFCCGLHITLKTQDVFGSLVAFGITLVITLQALINIGVVTGCLPTKGLALPFISYGGSHLLVSGVMIGVLLNIAMNGQETAQQRKKRSRKKQGSWA